MADLVAIGGPDFANARVVGPRCAVRPRQQIKLVRQVAVSRRMGDGIEIVRRDHGGEPNGRDSRRTARNAGSDLGHSKYFLRLEIVRIGVTRLLAIQHPHAASHFDAFGGGLHQRFIHQDRRRCGVLEIEVGVLSAFGKRRSEIMLEVSLGQAVAFEKEAIGLGHKKFLLSRQPGTD